MWSEVWIVKNFRRLSLNPVNNSLVHISYKHWCVFLLLHTQHRIPYIQWTFGAPSHWLVLIVPEPVVSSRQRWVWSLQGRSVSITSDQSPLTPPCGSSGILWTSRGVLGETFSMQHFFPPAQSFPSSSSSLLPLLRRWKQWTAEARKKLAMMATTDTEMPEKMTMR